ncbi:polyprenyl synthetase family protein [Pseudochryseolinea flava]|uniref:Polyprenyl synthetase family protein n=1 Tax=Pseudochryseolinea flava TaxID=2059302 RepID=A0A364Y8D9_9BACT|nr:polyprenyl synthetase family protein [Pseudochryseolinea flava]RAW03210.1 polyprenyl synthetase family protein [Pseudochryseolinea flava]
MLDKYLDSIEKSIAKNQFGKSPASLYEPIRYIMNLGGKRLRPMLTLLAYNLYKQDYKSIVPYSVAVEAFHNFTLMHDDIMDKAPLRRGKPTVHKKWNTSTAILSGDVMLVKVYEMFSDLDPGQYKTVIKAFNQCAAEVCEGQQWDMEFESEKTVAENDYINMIKLKTAVLLGFSLELGAILAGGSEADRNSLRAFGTNIGIGFQLKDDLLDAYADPKKFGKQVGGDIIANKKTFLLIKAIEKAEGKHKKELAGWLTATKFKKQEKVAAVKKIYDSLNIPALTEKKINQYFDKGFQHLNQLPPSSQRDFLEQFAKNLIERQS